MTVCESLGVSVVDGDGDGDDWQRLRSDGQFELVAQTRTSMVEMDAVEEPWLGETIWKELQAGPLRFPSRFRTSQTHRSPPRYPFRIRWIRIR